MPGKTEQLFKPFIGSKLVEDLIERGYLPQGTTRFVIDSGQPGGVARIYWAGFAQQDMLQTLMDGMEPIDEINDE